MSAGLLIFLVAIGVVGIFVLGMSLTLMFKGHHIDSEIGTNKHMKARGIKCASQEIREEERALQGGDSLKGCPVDLTGDTCGDGGCSTCGSNVR